MWYLKSIEYHLVEKIFFKPICWVLFLSKDGISFSFVQGEVGDERLVNYFKIVDFMFLLTNNLILLKIYFLIHKIDFCQWIAL